jgi:hypothetical protein
MNNAKNPPQGSRKDLPHNSRSDWTYFCILLLALIGATLFIRVPYIAWHVGFKGQLIAIGIFLRCMTECMQPFVRDALLQYQYRYGRSRLQNYEAILTNSYLTPNSSYRTRGTLVLLLAIPYILSAVYKIFIGGETTIPYTSPFDDKRYGIGYPSLGDFSVFNNSIYFFMSGYADFQQALNESQYDASKSPSKKLEQGRPIPYGYNLLLINDSTAAALDIPLQRYVNNTQNKLTGLDKIQLTSTVNAFVANYNASLDNFRDSDKFWNDTFSANLIGFKGLSSFSLFNPPANDSLGFMSKVPNQHESASCLVGVYPNSSTFWNDDYSSPTHPESLSFRKSSMMFSVTRTRCTATWDITKTSVKLRNGTCEERDALSSKTATNVLDDSMLSPYPLDTLAMLSNTIGYIELRNSSSPDRMPTYVVSVVMSYWARAAFMIPRMDTKKFPDTEYMPINEQKMKWTKSTLGDVGWLYAILAIQPGIAVIAIILKYALRKTPIGTGFGSIALLAGIDTADRVSLDLLQGAAFSGKLQAPVTLEVNPDNRQECIRYTFHEETNGNRNHNKIQRNKRYK